MENLFSLSRITLEVESILISVRISNDFGELILVNITNNFSLFILSLKNSSAVEIQLGQPEFGTTSINSELRSFF